MKKSKGYVLLALVVAFLVLVGWCATTYVSATAANQGNAAGTTSENGVKLGLDLSGGVSITYSIKDKNPSQEDINDTIAKLEERAESYTTEYSVYEVGGNRITVEIPGVYDANAVLEDLGSPGTLYFIAQTDADGNLNYSYDSSVGDYVLNYDIETLKANGSVIMSGDNIKTSDAVYNKDNLGNQEPVVSLSFDDEGAAAFAEASTKAYQNGQSIGIYYDDHFISVPTVKSAITDGQCVINNIESYETAQRLATFIRIGAMKLELEELESNVVGAQLGGQALQTSLMAGIIGLALVMLFMIIMYGVSGVAASIALAIYATLVVDFIYWFEITLTLPGIAGIILGIGMAVDANVIIFARIREEIAEGKTVAVAIKEGYKKARSAILDGQVTTFIAALVLMGLGSGTVKGFAYTLMISIVLSLFTALVITRVIMNALYAVGIKGEKFYGRAKERKAINFMKHRVVYFCISLAVIIAGIVGMISYASAGKGKLNYSLEFVGGTSIAADFNQSYTIEEIESVIVPEISEVIGGGTIQATTVAGTDRISFKMKKLDLDEREALNNLLINNYGIDASTIETQTIGSTISSEMRSNAVWAVVVSCIFMLLYIWLRFRDPRFAVSAILALVHDVLIVLTAYALLRIAVGNTFIACMLTIVGYSVNDTIVIFDRIRENLHGSVNQTKESLAEIANVSLTQTLARSINTSITTIIMVLMLIILGVSSIKEFSIPLMVGLISGSYSSIFIATELWYVMKLYIGKHRIKK